MSTIDDIREMRENTTARKK